MSKRKNDQLTWSLRYILASSISTFISMHSDTEIFANNLEKLLDNN